MAEATQDSTSRALTPVDEVRRAIDRMATQFKMALPSHIPVEKFVRCVQTAVNKNPDLANPEKCNRQSLYGAAMDCAHDGLLPDGKEAAIVPRKGKASYMPMVKGICKKMHNSGSLSSFNAQVVCEKDEYDAWADEKGEHFIHRKARGDRGRPWITYAYAIGKDGGLYFEEIDEAQMMKIRAMGADGGPWAGPFDDEMRRKSAIRRLSKRLDLSAEDDEFLHRDDDLFMPPDRDDTPQPAATPATGDQAQAPAAARRPRALSKVVDQARQGADGPTTIDAGTGEITGGSKGAPAKQDQGQPTDII